MSEKFLPTPKTLQNNPKRILGGHRLCPGCGIGIILKQVLGSIDNPLVISHATGCGEICFGAFPFSSFQDNWIHSLFENAASVISGVETMWQKLKKEKKLSKEQKKIKFVAIGGDGASYDIGLQWISGALERGHDFVYICTDNAGYMNTGFQRSSASPEFSATSTTPVGKEQAGKLQTRKNFTDICVAHQIPFVAQCSPSHLSDLMQKSKKAFNTEGPAVLNIFSPCPTNWKIPANRGIEFAKLAVETKFWPLLEFENGKLKITEKSNKKPIEDFLTGQKRFSHLFKPKKNTEAIQEIQKNIDDNWERLQNREKFKLD